LAPDVREMFTDEDFRQQIIFECYCGGTWKTTDRDRSGWIGLFW
jgi:hypothetical protein